MGGLVYFHSTRDLGDGCGVRFNYFEGQISDGRTQYGFQIPEVLKSLEA